MKSYRVSYERDGSGWWVASVRGVRGCHTQGRTVDEARRRILEALELFVDDARKAPLVDDVKLPSTAARAIRAYASLRKKADEEDRRAARAARRAVRVLRTGKQALHGSCRSQRTVPVRKRAQVQTLLPSSPGRRGRPPPWHHGHS